MWRSLLGFLLVCVLSAPVWAEAVGDKNGLLKPVMLEQLETDLKARLKSQIQIFDYRPEPRQPAGPGVLAAPAARAAARPAPSRQPQVSGTNLREQGVDEADLVKTDGRYLFAANSSAGVRIFDTQGQLKQVAALGFGQGVDIKGLYLLADRKQLLVMGQSYRQTGHVGYPARRIAGYWGGGSATTHFITVDVRTANKPRILRHLQLDGGLRESRRIHNRLYLIMDSYFSLSYPETYKSIATPRPLTDVQKAAETQKMEQAIDRWDFKAGLPQARVLGRAGSQSLLAGQTLYLENREEMPYQLTLLLSFDLDASDTRFQAVAYPGYVQNLYVSDKAIYLTSGYYSAALLASRSVPISSMPSQLIHKFALRGKGFDYRGSGLVLGDLGWNELSTFQMDEDSKGNLRVVTFNGARTNSHPDPVTRSPVIMTALAEHPQNRQLVTLSRLPNAASPKPLGKPGERLYGARLFNDYAYFVTFRNTDPLYAVDLRNPRQLKVVGELVIPGFSDYLHPVTDKLLLGVGKAAEAQSGAIEGWKLSLFDIANPARPKEIDKVHLGSWGSDSPANRNYHAFTSLAINSNTLTRVALPVTVMPADGGNPRSGLHQFEVDHRSRKLKHVGAFHPGVMANGWYWDDNDRSILIDNKVYYYRSGNFYQGDWGKQN